jgi:two-component system sensor histidine kinase MtrB
MRLRRPVALVRRRWRRSLLTRVVTATVALGLVVVLVLGQFLYGLIADGLMDSRSEAARNEALRLAGGAQSQFEQAGISDTRSATVQIIAVVSGLRGPVDETDRAVLIRQAEDQKLEDAPVGSAVGGITEADIPPDLRDDVNSDPPRQQSKIVRLTAPDGSEQSAILVGQLITIPVVGTYELYVAFRLDRDKDLLEVVRGTFIVGGFLLVFLVAGVAYVVTRWVVSPVRQAARTAEELASGRFDRRMRVRGEDDLARLGRAFNEMAASLENQIHRLEELSRVQRRFVSDVSHELRTPLTTIRMAGEVIYESRASFDPVLSRSAELLQDQLDRFEALLADLLEISRYDAGAAVLEADPEDLRDVVARVVDGLRPLGDRRGCLLRLQLPEQECVAEIDARRVERVVRNLLGNAIEHGEGLPIDIRVACEDTAVAVGVRDRGVGLRPGELSVVFERFWRGDPARARSTGGTGLGLAIALEDAHLHGGWLQAWGEPGRGAHFVLTLPRRPGLTLISSPLPLNPLGSRTYGPGAERAETTTDRAPDDEPAGTRPAAGARRDPAATVVSSGDVPHAPGRRPVERARPRS